MILEVFSNLHDSMILRPGWIKPRMLERIQPRMLVRIEPRLVDKIKPKMPVRAEEKMLHTTEPRTSAKIKAGMLARTKAGSDELKDARIKPLGAGAYDTPS